MDNKEKMSLRKLQRLADAETITARPRFEFGIEDSSPYVGLAVLYEQIGKMSRCFNKMGLAHDEEIRQQWQRELKENFVKSVSIIDRMYLAFVETDMPYRGHFGLGQKEMEEIARENGFTLRGRRLIQIGE